MKGMAIYKSLGGKNLDEPTLMIWYGMLKPIKDRHWEEAVIVVCKNQRELARCNFVAEIGVVVRELARREQKTVAKPEIGEEQVDPAVVKEFMQTFLKEFQEK